MCKTFIFLLLLPFSLLALDYKNLNPEFIIIKQFYTDRPLNQSGVLQIWLQHNDHPWIHASYDICRFSGKLGPKKLEGDLQAPEGFYRITQNDLAPWSRYDTALKLNYPNAYDQSLGRTGSHIMIHGGCESAGCFAMGSDIWDIYIFAEEAFKDGVDSIPISIYPTKSAANNHFKHSKPAKTVEQ